MMLSIAKALQPQLAEKMADPNLSIMMLFFDGEEAIQEWTHTDSIYGARHLAKKWDQEGFLPKIVRSKWILNNFKSKYFFYYKGYDDFVGFNWCTRC